MKVTADTITDEQIRKLRDWAQRLLSDARFALLRGEHNERGEVKSPTLLREINEARARCAEILNDRLSGV